ncbi:MAG: 23S rRNA (guanosine(2251)-2'-O)-methyltransferase RlmB [Verrucomicrobia bacterium]|nr:23S rRNA (guanosine(2251)-2'-O)-methyltransferase RlmB [Verrucomicrobiota bacterium]
MAQPRRQNDRARSGQGKPARSDREFLYGRQPIRELLRAGRRRVASLYVLSSVRPTPELDEVIALAEASKIKIAKVDSLRVESMVGDVNHQGVVADVFPFRYVSYKKMLSDAGQDKNALFLFLDGLEDPQNVGSLLRSAEAAGVTGVVIPEHRAVGITPAVVRASAGAAEHMIVAKVPNLVRCMRLLKDRGVWFAGLEAGDEATLISDTDLTGPLGIVVGSEGKGMRRLVRENCDYLVKLPMFGNVSSLNAGVAGAIAMFEVLRQRGSAGKGES